MLDVPRLPSRTRRDDATAAIRRIVLDGVMPAGSQLRDNELAAALGVSRSTVREAIGPLVEEGILIYEPYKGIRVAEISNQTMVDIGDVRVALESLAARRVASGLTEDGRLSLDKAIGRLESARAAGDGEAINDCHFAFHRLIFELASNPILEHMWGDIEVQIRLALRIDQDVRPDFDRTVESHKAYLTTILARDSDQIDVSVRSHIIDAVGELIKRRPEASRLRGDVHSDSVGRPRQA
jgi:DNA-binding GntR family transcriptional regulator